jgi:hypothetical protein
MESSALNDASNAMSYESFVSSTTRISIQSCTDDIDDDVTENDTTTIYQVYYQRWLVLGSFALLSMTSSWIWITWSPISPNMAPYWHVTLADVDNLMGIYMYIYVPCSFVSLYLVVNYIGLKNGLITAGVFNMIGAIVRYYYMDHYRIVYIGTILCAIAQTFTLSTPPLISTRWFASSERGTATSLGILANQFGTAIGLGITTMIRLVDDDTLNDDTNNNYSSLEQPINRIVLQRYLAMQTIVSVLALVLIVLFSAEFPPSPPSKAAAMIHPTIDCCRNNDDDEDDEKHCSKQSPSTRIVCKNTNITLSTPLVVVPNHIKHAHNNGVDYVESTKSTTTTMKNWGQKITAMNQSNNSNNNSEMHYHTLTYFESLQRLLYDRNCLSFVICFGTSIGVYYTVPTLLSQLTPSHWSSKWDGSIGILYQLMGIVSSYGAGYVLDNTQRKQQHNHQQQHRTLSIKLLAMSCITLLTLLLSLLALQSGVSNNGGGAGAILVSSSTTTTTILPMPATIMTTMTNMGIIIGIIGTGMSLAAFNTVGIEYGTGLAYPADEIAIAGVLEASAELFGFLWVTVGGILMESSHVQQAVVVFMVAVGIALERIWNTNGIMKRP